MADFKVSEAEAVLDFIESCDMVKIEQLTKLYPEYNIDKITRFLINRKRVHMSSDGEYLHGTPVGTTDEPRPNKALIATLGVLSDVMSKVKFHAKAPPPAQISFLAHSGELYEIVYVGYGLEAMVSSMYGSLQNVNPEEVRRIVVLEDKSQIEKIKERIPNIMRFALVKPNGGYDYLNPSPKG